MLEKDEISLFHPLSLRELGSDVRQVADVLVSHDERSAAERQPVLTHVGTADPGDFHLHQSGIRWNIRQLELAQFRRRWADLHRGERLLGQLSCLL